MSITPVSSLPAAAPAAQQLAPVSTPKPATAATATAATAATDKPQSDHPASAAGKPESGSLTAQDAQKVAEKLNQQLDPANTSVRFSVDDGSGQVVIKVMDTKNDQVIRQIPNEEALAWSQAMSKNQGIILNTKA
ncbi:flagellar protein FlaG [Malikia sp.]|uniref:flagellar protein FlaG n=1 Tax=Malikia sp. TaxID=2070706 RepID=UPI002625C1C0|nr:flagellar protein FlaG [Malikia sp.]MDD2727890.1 flagellar protein FlaG [Malikia sp.]